MKMVEARRRACALRTRSAFRLRPLHPVPALLLEGLLVAALGVVLAFAANALSPRGLKLTRDYFYQDQRSTARTNTPVVVAPGTATNSASPHDLLAARLRDKGLRLADSNQVIQFFHDPRRDQGLVVFVDARDDAHYQDGHIPGAYQFDYYYPEKHFASVMPVCQMAQEIVIYCNGGDCEDSEFAASFLRDAGVPKEKLFVYGGGMTEWVTNRLPIELDGRQSGRFRDQPK